MRRIVAIALAFAFTSLGAACGGDSPTGPSASIAGSYSLRTVNGSPLPYTVIQMGTDKVELMSETVVLANGGTFTQQGVLRITENGQSVNESYADAGAYTRNGTAITFTFNSDGSTGTGTVSGNSITVAIDGISLVYQK